MNDPKTTPRQPGWRFGRDWQGKRCLAKTRKGTACQKPALTGKSRCQLHGGKGGAPTGEQNGNYRTGYYTKETMQKNREARRRIAELIVLGKKIRMFR